MKLFQKIVNQGTSSKNDSFNNQYVRITNSINLLYIFGLGLPLIGATILSTNDGIQSYGRYILLIAFSLFSLLLNFLNQNKCAKITTSILPFFAIIVFPIFFNHFVHAGMFIWIPYATMAIGAVSFFIFSFEKEKALMLSVIGFYIFSIMTFDELLISHFNQLPDLEFIKKYYLYYLSAKIAITILLYTMFFIFKIMSLTNRLVVVSTTGEINQKNQTLNILNTTLENKVAEHTAQLTLQNERIKHLAHTNAHEIRAYIARIMGLQNLMLHKISQEEKKYCESKIAENILDLDKVTQKLSKELIEEK